MNKKSEIELERQILIKTVKSLVRLKHSVAADRELNDLLPEKVMEFENAVQHGQLLTLEIPEVNDVTTEA